MQANQPEPLGGVFHVIFPLWAPVGGVIKILDYLNHVVEIGFDSAIAWGPPLKGPEAPINEHVAFKKAMADPRIEFRLLRDLELEHGAWALFSEPVQHIDIERALPEGSPMERIIHLVQNTRHANPNWHLGFPYLLLHRPISRIFVTNEVAEATLPIANTHLPARTIVEGHGWEYFSRQRTAEPTDHLTVGYTTWKSDIGDQTAELLADDSRFTFKAIREPANWPTLRDAYHSCDVWLSAPGPEEGFYIPGIEAMAASCCVISALIGGNKAYLEPEVNCLAPDFEDPAGHASALERLLEDHALRRRLIAAGHETTQRFTLDRERLEFQQFVADLAQAQNPAA